MEKYIFQFILNMRLFICGAIWNRIIIIWQGVIERYTYKTGLSKTQKLETYSEQCMAAELEQK